ncbi:hypothetical protein Y032_0913g3024 [Ancylostoma ceylanicum]|uniref:Uncharacterized protein n=1 Tax=Ancylostoma ceylanicum TaxID=53326 RepID=A0A016W8U9_9BILA|nr:hypothetical protein Y032_0913g3024 [Ancylostoma ceylanicum]
MDRLAVYQLVTTSHHLNIFGLLSTWMYFKSREDVGNREKYGVLWPRIPKFSAGCTRDFIPQWKLTEGTALFSNTEILVRSIIAAAEEFISINFLDLSPLPPCLRGDNCCQMNRTVNVVLSPKKEKFRESYSAVDSTDVIKDPERRTDVFKDNAGDSRVDMTRERRRGRHEQEKEVQDNIESRNFQEGDTEVNRGSYDGVAKGIYLGICNFSKAEESVKKRADFKLYHETTHGDSVNWRVGTLKGRRGRDSESCFSARNVSHITVWLVWRIIKGLQMLHHPLLDDLEPELHLFLVYKTANGSYRHYRVCTRTVDDSTYYFVDTGEKKPIHHISLDHLVRYYQVLIYAIVRRNEEKKLFLNRSTHNVIQSIESMLTHFHGGRYKRECVPLVFQVLKVFGSHNFCNNCNLGLTNNKHFMKLVQFILSIAISCNAT